MEGRDEDPNRIMHARPLVRTLCLHSKLKGQHYLESKPV
jgi:hypothetical protein